MASSSDAFTTRADGKQQRVPEEQSTGNQNEKVIPITDQANLNDEEDTKPEEAASMGNYIVRK